MTGQLSIVKQIVDRLLENTDQVRVCTSCEREVGLAQTSEGQEKSHSLCKRHAMDYGMSLEGLTDDQFAPDLKEHPELVAQDQALQKELDRAVSRHVFGP
jgi:hypothetical protein